MEDYIKEHIGDSPYSKRLLKLVSLVFVLKYYFRNERNKNQAKSYCSLLWPLLTGERETDGEILAKKSGGLKTILF